MKKITDKYKNVKNFLSRLLSYKSNELSVEERNSFERDIQRDPFLEEAIEGFEYLSPEKIRRDMGILNNKLALKIKGRNKMYYYSIAASIAIILTISSVIVFIVRSNKDQVSEIAVANLPVEITKPQPLREPAISIKDNIGEKASSESESPKSPVNKGGEKKGLTREKADETLMEMQVSKFAERENDLREIQIYDTNKEILVSDQLAAAEVAAPSLAKPDSQVEVRLNPAISDLSEVVVVGYEKQRSESMKEVTNSGYISPQPVDGRTSFNKYIEENIQRPDTSTVGQRVVVIVRFLVRTDGKIDSIKIVKSPDEAFSDEAVRLIKSGPPWKPAEDQGKLIEEEVRVRIVFR